MLRLASTAIGLILGFAFLQAEVPIAEPAETKAAAALEERFALHEAALPESSCFEIPFRETRSFSFRRDDRHLTGRILRERSGKERFVFMYEVPLRLRLLYADGNLHYARGSQDPVPLESSEATLQLFAALFRKDIEAITREWTISIEGEEDGGQGDVIVLTPKSAASAEGYARVQLVFEGSLLKTVRVHRKNHVEHRYDFGTVAALDCTAIASQF